MDKPQQLKVILTFDIHENDYTENFAQQLAVNVKEALQEVGLGIFPEDSHTDNDPDGYEEVTIYTNLTKPFDFVL